MKYGLLKYDGFSNNLGDEIQSIAAQAFFPQIDVFVQREELKNFLCAETVKIILNGWYMHDPEQWPPSPDIEPLLTSIHIERSNPAVAKKMLFGKGGDFFRHYGRPVGARDLSTLELFQQAEIPAFFSGCLTLTLQRDPLIAQERYICAVDISQELLGWLQTKTKLPVYNLSNEIPVNMPFNVKFRLAQEMLEIYQGAHCVVTGRLHTAMPCLAFETPVLLVNYAKDQERFFGLNTLVRHCSEENLVNGQVDFDFAQPQPNSAGYLEYRGKLIRQCSGFIGVDAYGRSKMRGRNTTEEKALLMQELCQWRRSQKVRPPSRWSRFFD